MSSDSTRTVGAVGWQWWLANPQAQQFVSQISALYHNLAPLYDPDNALLQDPNAWSKVQQDERFRAFIAQRLAKVARIEWVLEPHSDRPEDVDAVATIEPMLRDLPQFTSSRRHLAKFAFWGRAHCWIEGRRRLVLAGKSAKFEDGIIADWWMPTFLRPLDRRQVIYQPEQVDGPDGEKVTRVKTLLGTIDAGRHVEMRHPECLVECVYDDEVERLGYGRGLLETLYHVYWIKGIVRRIGLSGLEKWAHGIVVAQVDATARAGLDETSQNTAQTMLNTIQAMRSNGAIVVDVNDKVDVLTADKGGQDATHAWLAYCDEGAAQLILSAVRPMGGGEGGAYKQAETENKSTEDLLDCDRELIDEQITRSLVRMCFDLNAANFVALGIGGAKCPRFRSHGLKDEDPEKVARVLEAGQRLGMQIAAADAHRRLRVKMPARGEDRLTAPKQPSPFGGFGDAPFGGEGGIGGGRPDGVERSDMREKSLARSALSTLLRFVGRRRSA